MFPIPDQTLAHASALSALARIDDDVLAQVADEVTIAAGELLSHKAIRGLLTIAVMDAIMIMQAKKSHQAGHLAFVPLNLQPLPARRRALVILDELFGLPRFGQLFERNFRIAEEKDEKRKLVLTRVLQDERSKMADVPPDQARELRALLAKAGCTDPDATVRRVLSVFDARVEDGRHLNPVAEDAPPAASVIAKTPELEHRLAEEGLDGQQDGAGI